MTHIDQRIRDWLAEADHEDWCDTRVHVNCCCGKGCNCFLGPANAAIAAVLDLPVAVVMPHPLPDTATGYNLASRRRAAGNRHPVGPSPGYHMRDLDQQIRAAIDRAVMHPTSTVATLQFADALRAVCALHKANSHDGFCDVCAMGVQVNNSGDRCPTLAAIATQLGITQEATP